MKIFCSKTPNRKSFHFRYTLRGRKKVIKIADFESLPLSEIRDIARKYRGMVAQNIDPAAERQKIAAVPDMKDFCAKYMEWSMSYKRSFRSDELIINANFLPTWGSTPITDIKKKDIHNYLQRIKNRSSGATANRHRALLSKMFSYAIELEIMDGENPVKRVGKFSEHPPKPQFLDKGSIRRLLTVLDDHPNNRSALLVKFLLFTGLRRGEVLKLKFQDTLEPGRIYIPMENAKGKRARYVELNSLAQEVLEELERLKVPGNEYCFPSPILPGEHLTNPSKFWRSIREKAGLPNLKMHGLRHCFASLSIAAGATLYEVQSMLGHSNHKTTQIYAHLSDSAIKSAVENTAKEINMAMGS
jgi:integrase